MLPTRGGRLGAISPRPVPRRVRRAVLPIGAVVVVTLGVFAAQALIGGPPAAPTLTTPSPRTPIPPTAGSPAAGTVGIDPGDYTGEPFAEVREGLIARGLRVREVLTDRGGPPGTVTLVGPLGALPVNTMVTVTVVADRGGTAKKTRATR